MPVGQPARNSSANRYCASDLTRKGLLQRSIGATLTANFTIYASGGTITGRGTGKPHGSGTYESFAGTLVATGGTGRYAHAHGHGGFYGTFDRKNYDLTVQTTGKLSY